MMRRLLLFVLTFVMLASPAIVAFFWQPHPHQQVLVIRAQLPRQDPAQR